MLILSIFNLPASDDSPLFNLPSVTCLAAVSCLPSFPLASLYLFLAHVVLIKDVSESLLFWKSHNSRQEKQFRVSCSQQSLTVFFFFFFSCFHAAGCERSSHDRLWCAGPTVSTSVTGRNFGLHVTSLGPTRQCHNVRHLFPSAPTPPTPLAQVLSSFSCYFRENQATKDTQPWLIRTPPTQLP